MAQLQDILYKVSIRSVHGELDRSVDNLQTDSRLAGPGSLFIAMRGTHIDGHSFIPQVIAAGATLIVCEDLPAGLQPGVVGMYQINVQVPVDAPTGDLTLVLSQDGNPANSTVLPVKKGS